MLRQFTALAATFGVTLFAFLGYQGVAVLAPYYLAAHHSGEAAVGATTTVFMVTATFGAAAMAMMRTRNDPRLPLAAALIMLAAPCFVLPVSPSVTAVLLLNGFRGIGFGLLGVLLGSAVMLSAPPGRRGLVLGFFGLITSGVAALGQSGALALERERGFQVAFTVAGAVGVAALLPVIATKAPTVGYSPRPASGSHPREKLLLLGIVFFVVATTYGAVVSFVPDQMQLRHAGDAVSFFLVLALAMPTGRLTTGWLLDQFHPTRLLVVAIVLGAMGLTVLARTEGMLASVAAPALYGLSFGALSTGIQATMATRVGAVDYNLVNGVFNAAWNAGMAAGGLGFGLLAASAGYAQMFLIAAGLIACATVPLLLDRYQRPIAPTSEVIANT